jgi:hypothetical protein
VRGYAAGRDGWRRGGDDRHQKREVRPLAALTRSPRIVALGALLVLFALLRMAGQQANSVANPTGISRWGQDGVASGVGDAHAVDVEAAVRGIFEHGNCVTAAAATTELERVMARAGAVTWTLSSAPGLSPDACATAAVDPSDHRIVLLRAMTPAVRAAVRDLADKLLANCYRRNEAIALATSVLMSAGERGFQVRSDGPVAAPVDRWAEAVQHVQNGCYVYSGAGWLADGRRVYYLAGGSG